MTKSEAEQAVNKLAELDRQSLVHLQNAAVLAEALRRAGNTEVYDRAQMRIKQYSDRIAARQKELKNLKSKGAFDSVKSVVVDSAKKAWENVSNKAASVWGWTKSMFGLSGLGLVPLIPVFIGGVVVSAAGALILSKYLESSKALLNAEADANNILQLNPYLTEKLSASEQKTLKEAIAKSVTNAYESGKSEGESNPGVFSQLSSSVKLMGLAAIAFVVYSNVKKNG